MKFYKSLAIGFLAAITALPEVTVAKELSFAGAGGERRPNVIVIFTDDMGFADLGIQGQAPDLATPNLDQLAAEGVRFTDGYITAPQCVPSRAGMVTGRYQQRFGLDENKLNPLPAGETTIADRLQSAGYVTGMIGKWHLSPNAESKKWAAENGKQYETRSNGRLLIPLEDRLPFDPHNRGFTETFNGNMNRYWATYSLDGKNLNPKGENVVDKRYRLDVQSDAAAAFIERNHEQPFYLYLAYFAPHLPLEAPEKYLSRFPGEMPERRRYALAMISAMDDGVGRIMETLQKHDLEEDTLVFFLSDNGAPLKLTKTDSPVDSNINGWNGSLNDPMVGEKGMLSEGGIRIPFVARWKGVLPTGKVYDQPVISLDVGATAVALAGLGQPEELDGVNLIPYLTGEKAGSPHDTLYWRFWNQSAIRKGKWKYLQAGGTSQFLFDLSSPELEKENLIEHHPKIAAGLQEDLKQWAAELKNPGVPDEELQGAEKAWYDHFFGSGGAKIRKKSNSEQSKSKESASKPQLREVIVSHTDNNGILQLFRMKEDGSDSVQLTHSEKGCRMPAVSPDGKKLVYAEQVDHSLSLWLSDIDGKNPRVLTSDGMNLLPSWLSDGRHIVWMKAERGQPKQDPATNSQIHLMNTETGESRRLFSDPEQIQFSDGMPSISPQGNKVAFVSNRSGTFRIWVSEFDGSNARMISTPPSEQDENLKLPIEQKVPAWSPDGQWIAHWEGVEMIHMSKFTGVKDPKRDQQISATFNVWVVSSDGKERRKVGRGDDPTWSPDGFVTRAFADQQRGGPKVMVETESGEKELVIVPTRRNWGRFTWVPE